MELEETKDTTEKLADPEIRCLYDMKEVIYDAEWLKTAPNLELYYMHRGVREKDGLRYDVTIIPPRMMGKEFVKTKGHEHSNNFSEIYIVLEGEALYLLQKQEQGFIKDVFAVKAKRGESVMVPAGCGHVTINPSKRKLVEANWISKNCKNNYDSFVKKRGACYYYTTTGWIKNDNYGKIPELRFEKPLKKMPSSLEFLHGK